MKKLFVFKELYHQSKLPTWKKKVRSVNFNNSIPNCISCFAIFQFAVLIFQHESREWSTVRCFPPGTSDTLSPPCPATHTDSKSFCVPATLGRRMCAPAHHSSNTPFPRRFDSVSTKPPRLVRGMGPAVPGSAAAPLAPCWCTPLWNSNMKSIISLLISAWNSDSCVVIAVL